MIAAHQIMLASPRDSEAIATLSRDVIEHGLQWSWTPSRVRRAISDRATNVIVARDAATVVGFAIIQYLDDEAHLLLMAVRASHRRRGIAASLIAWMDQTFQVAGIGTLRAEVRESNSEARSFYRALGFNEAGLKERYYQGVENAVRLIKKSSTAG